MSVNRAALTESALERVDRLHSRRRKAFCVSHVLFREVSLLQLHVLSMLEERDEMTVSQLAAVLNVSTPSASAVVDRLEENRLVERTRDLADRRVVRVSPTDRGRAAVGELVGMRRAETTRLLTAMTDDELGHMVAALNALERVLSEAESRVAG
jgi:DNA-binding MarR family transcriptional regulator